MSDSSPFTETQLERMTEFLQSTGSAKSVSTADTRVSMHEETITNLFKLPVVNLISDKPKDGSCICIEELGDILEDCFRIDDENDEGRPLEEFYKDGVLENMVPKNKKTLKKYKNYQNDYLEYCEDRELNPTGKVNSQFTLCNYFHDR